MAPLTRRAFLEGAALSVGAALAPASLLAEPTPAPTPSDRADGEWHRAPCEMCGVACGLLVQVRGGRAAAVKGDPDCPTASGLACARGYFGLQALYAGERRTTALVRRGGALVPAPIDEVLDTVARALRDTVARHGRGAATLLGAPGPTASSVALRATYGPAARVASFADLDRADVVVLWHHNLAESHPVLFSRLVARRRRDPSLRIVDVATRTTRTSYAADRALLAEPASAIALANAIAQVLVDSHATDERSLRDRVEYRARPGQPASRGQYEGFLHRYQPERMEKVTGIPADAIRWLASLYADRTKRVVSVWGAALDQQPHGAWANEALHAMHLLRGRAGTAGEGVLPLAAPSANALDGAPGPAQVLAAFRAVERGTTRFLWVQDADPLAILPNAERYRRAAEGNCFVVLSSAWPGRSDAIADVILPSALWIERDARIARADGGTVQVPALLPPPGDASAARAQRVAVARRAGAAWPFGPAAASGVVVAPGAHGNPDVQGMQVAVQRGVVSSGDDAASRASLWMRPHVPSPERPDAQFPFWLERGDVLEHGAWGAATMQVPALRRAMPGAYLEMHRDDATALGLRDRDRVRVVSRRGSIELPLRIDYRSQPARGRVFVPTFDPTVPVNQLALDSTCPDSGEPDYACAVRIERISGGGRA